MVVPFRGDAKDLRELRARLTRLELRPGDSITVVDNTPRSGALEVPAQGEIVVIHADEVGAPGFARNCGAEHGLGEWLVFFDADTYPSADLLDRYFDHLPPPRTALMAGGIKDEQVPADGRPVARYAYIRRFMSQDDTFRFGEWGYPKSANVAFRRSAFASVGGFRENIRAAEDADLTYRLRAAGWGIERREEAIVVHRSRHTVRGFLWQKLCHGAGGAWLDREYPGAAPARRRLGLLWWGVRHACAGLVMATRKRDRDTALWALLDPLELLAHEFGRSLPNERPLSARIIWRHLCELRERSGATRLPGGGPEIGAR